MRNSTEGIAASVTAMQIVYRLSFTHQISMLAGIVSSRIVANEAIFRCDQM